MTTPIVRFPVVCPECGSESLASISIATVAAGLISGELQLNGDCPHGAWQATALERDQIHEYLAAPILEQQLRITSAHPS